MRFFYSFCMYLISPYLLFRLWLKGRKIPAYRQRITERFALNLPQCPPIDIWVHAVSLGEVIAATPLIEAMLGKQWRVLVTTMTPTGAQRVQAAFNDRVIHRYIPYDLPCAMQRFYTNIKPRIGVIMETELWPNLIAQAKKADIPLLLVNARLSERSCQGYQKIKGLISPLLNDLKQILAQTSEDAQRFIKLGAQSSRVAVYGNIKFDLQINNIASELYQQLKARWGASRVVVMAASTHDDEEQQILTHWKKLQQAIPDAVLLIAPRHPERFQKVSELSQRLGFKTGIRSQPESLSPENEVVILDCMGELMGFYQASDYAFVGGSLVPVGGHNVLEPIALQVPVISGKQVHNFKSICRDLETANAIILVDNAQQLIESIIRLHQDNGAREQLVSQASEVLRSNQGALQRYMERIAEVLAESEGK